MGVVSAKMPRASNKVLRKYSNAPPLKLIRSRLQHIVGNSLAFVHRFGTGSFHLELFHRFYRNAERQIASVTFGARTGQREPFNVNFVLKRLPAVYDPVDGPAACVL